MRQIESYIMYAALYTLWDGYAPATKGTALALVGLLVAHFVVEKPRWQFIIGYIVSAYASWNALNDVPNSGWWILVGSSLLMTCATCACLMPVAKLPELSGPYKKVGVTVKTLKAASLANESQKRGVTVKVFYPAAVVANGNRAPYISSRVIRSLARSVKTFPPWMLHYITLAWSQASRDAKLSNDKPQWPVVVYSHGLEGHPDVYQILATDLASWGVIVVSICHNDDTCLHVQYLDDGNVAPSGGDRSFISIPKEVDNVLADKFQFRNKQLNIRVQDFRYVVDMLHSSDHVKQWGDLAGRFDLARIAAGGHSFGGATAFTASVQDARIKTCFTHDLWGLPVAKELHDTGFTRIPVQFMMSERWVKDAEVGPVTRALAEKSKHARSEIVTIQGTAHNNFADIPLFASIIAKKMNVAGPIDVRRAFQLINRTTWSFIERTLINPSSNVSRLQETELLWS